MVGFAPPPSYAIREDLRKYRTKLEEGRAFPWQVCRGRLNMLEWGKHAQIRM